jgi:hypothetical protein
MTFTRLDNAASAWWEYLPRSLIISPRRPSQVHIKPIVSFYRTQNRHCHCDHSCHHFYLGSPTIVSQHCGLDQDTNRAYGYLAYRTLSSNHSLARREEETL